MSRFRSLQALRAIAALLVVYFHAVLQFGDAPWNASLLPLFGSSGVDIFFVLSGFVMWSAHPPGGAGLRTTFYRKRIARIVPLYWTVTGAALVVALAAPTLVRSIRPETAHVLASLFFIPHPNPAFAPGTPNWITPVVVPGWTLNYEMFFYLCFGLVLPFGTRARLLAMGTVFSLLVALRTVVTEPPAALAFYAPSYLLEFMYGALIARYLERLSVRDSVSAALLFVVALMSLVAVDVGNVAGPPGIVRGIPAAAIVIAALSVERCGRWPVIAPLQRLGDASYSLYLTHGFAIAGLRTTWRVLGIATGTIAQFVFVFIVLFVAGIASVAVYRFVEKPMLSRTESSRRSRHGIAVAPSR